MKTFYARKLSEFIQIVENSELGKALDNSLGLFIYYLLLLD